MLNKSQLISIFCCTLFSLSTSQAHKAPHTLPPSQSEATVVFEQPRIQLAILLDTSNSMDGLINQARSQIWTIVNEFTTAHCNGQKPLVEVALYQYGNSSLPKRKGYTERLLHFTQDLDGLSEKLFKLSTNGGQEYCGTALDHALDDLEWSKAPHDLRVIVIAGNEPFTQGPLDYRTACKLAARRDILINTLHCGSYDAGISGQWKTAADLTQGSYMCIEQDHRVVHLPTPYDDELVQLNDLLNRTYIYYGSEGARGRKKQAEQDSLSIGAGSILSRVASKASSYYTNTSWDIVDASEAPDFEIQNIPVKTLPENMQKMTLQERLAYVQKMAEKRAELKTKIVEKSSERKSFLEKASKAEAGPQTFEKAVSQKLRQQAQSKGYSFH